MNLKDKIRSFFTLSPAHKGGFTLVELIVVIAILGILAGVSVPAYNGYIKKADKAADEQLLAAVNKAFTSACLDNGISNYEVTSATITINANGLIDNSTAYISSLGGVTDDEGTKINTAFGTYYAGNENAAFKTVASQDLRFANGMFGLPGEIVTSVQIGGIDISVDSSLAAALNANHSFQTIGADGLLGKVDTISNIASALVGLTDDEGNLKGTFANMVYGFDENGKQAYMMNLMETLDMDEGEFTEVFMVKDESGNITGWNDVAVANSLVLTAAQKTVGMDTSFLGTAGSASTLRTQLDNPETATDAMAKLALTYGMYTSYMAYTGGTDISNDILNSGNFIGMTEVLEDIESEAFKEYLAGEQGQKDLAAYMASMQIVNDSANQSSEAAQNILTNGFTDPELLSALESLMGG